MATVPVPLRDRPKISQYSMSSGQTSLLFFNVVNKNQLFGFRVRLHYNTDPDPNPSQASFGSGSLQIKGSKKKKFQEDFQQVNISQMVLVNLNLKLNNKNKMFSCFLHFLGRKNVFTCSLACLLACLLTQQVVRCNKYTSQTFFSFFHSLYNFTPSLSLLKSLPNRRPVILMGRCLADVSNFDNPKPHASSVTRSQTKKQPNFYQKLPSNFNLNGKVFQNSPHPV